MALERHLGRTSESGRRMEPWRLGALATVAAVTCVVIARLRLRPRRSSARVAFVGNSILYFNDVPRLVEALWTPGHSKAGCRPS